MCIVTRWLTLSNAPIQIYGVHAGILCFFYPLQTPTKPHSKLRRNRPNTTTTTDITTTTTRIGLMALEDAEMGDTEEVVVLLTM